MKDAPFSITFVLLATIFAMMIAGGLLAVVFKGFGFPGFLGLFLASFLTVPLGSIVRQATARSAADQAGVSGASPFAFSLPVRLAIGAIAAAAVSYVITLTSYFTLGFLTGAVAALVTSVILILVFYFKTAFGN